MGWIKIEHTTPDKPEVHEMADQIGTSPEAVLGGLVRLFIWADQQADKDCYARGVTKASLDRISCVTGLGDAMQKVGWLAPNGNGFVFVNFDRHNGGTAKSRAQSALRMEKKRLRESYAPSVTKASPDLDKDLKTPLIPPGGKDEGSADAKKKPRTKTKTEDPADIPESLDTPAFRTAWAEWEQYRREKRQALKPTTRRKQLATLSKHPPDVAVAALEESMRQGWTGVFPDRIAEQPTGLVKRDRPLEELV